MNGMQAAIDWISQRKPRRIVVLSGAGMSAESGIPTFRGPGGLWENHRAEDLATPGAFARDPHLVWRWYEWRRELIRNAEPNEGHRAVARLEQHPALQVDVVTQNVDGLHTRAGSRNVIEIHGNITQVRCLAEQDVRDATEPFATLPPHCECGSLLRPNVVWFGEALPPHAWERAAELVSRADLVLIVGTSGVVYPAAGLIGFLEGGRSIEVNPAATPLSTSADFVIQGRAGEVLPSLADAIEGRLR
jgi:NAD-dependent deacetylase